MITKRVLILVIACLAFAVLLLEPSRGQNPTPCPDVAQAIVDGTNAQRTREGLNPLSLEPALVTAAAGHSLEMARLNYFAHESPTLRLQTPTDRIRLAGGYDVHIAENIYQCTWPRAQVADHTVTAWMNSPAHHHNLMNPDYNRVGVGVVEWNGGYWVTQNFAYHTIEVTDVQKTVQGEGFEVALKFDVVSGPSSGLVLFRNQKVGDWSAPDRTSVRFSIPQEGVVQIGQRQGGGPDETIDAEIPIWSSPPEFDHTEMPLLRGGPGT